MNALQFECRLAYAHGQGERQRGDDLLLQQIGPLLDALCAAAWPADIDIRRSVLGGERHWAIQLRVADLTQWEDLPRRLGSAWQCWSRVSWHACSLDAYGYEDAALRQAAWRFDSLACLQQTVLAEAATQSQRQQAWHGLLLALLPGCGLSLAEAHYLMQFLRRHWATQCGLACPEPMQVHADSADPAAPALPSALTEWQRQTLLLLLPLAAQQLRRRPDQGLTPQSWARLMLWVHLMHNRDGQSLADEMDFCGKAEAAWAARISAAERQANALRAGLTLTSQALAA